MVSQHVVEGGPHRVAVHIHGDLPGHGVRRAGIRLLVGEVVGGGDESVLQSVDPQAHGLPMGHGADVPGHLGAALVRFLNDRAHQLPRSGKAFPEPADAFVHPVTHDATGVGCRRHHRLIAGDGRRAADGDADVDVGAGDLPQVDGVLQVQLVVGKVGARRADGGDAAGQEEARAARAHLVGPRAGVVIHMVVEADEPGDDRAAGEVEHPCARGNRGPSRRADGCDVAALDHDRLVFRRDASGAVDHPHVGECHGRRVDHDEAPSRVREPGALGGEPWRAGQQQQAKKRERAHESFLGSRP